MAHIIACIWVFASRIENFSPDTWVVRFEYRDDPDDTVYLAALYWTFTTMSTVGYGDITARTGLEQTLSIILMLFGVVFFSFIIGSISSIFNRIDSQEAYISQKMDVIDEFARESKIEKDLKNRLRHAFAYSTEKSGFTWIDK